MHPLAVAARGDQARAAKVGQVPRYFGLAGMQDLHKKADADLAARYQVQQTQARGVRQGAEEAIERQARARARDRHEYSISQHIRLDIYVPRRVGCEHMRYSVYECGSRKAKDLERFFAQVRTQNDSLNGKVPHGRSRFLAPLGMTARDEWLERSGLAKNEKVTASQNDSALLFFGVLRSCRGRERMKSHGPTL